MNYVQVIFFSLTFYIYYTILFDFCQVNFLWISYQFLVILFINALRFSILRILQYRKRIFFISSLVTIVETPFFVYLIILSTSLSVFIIPHLAANVNWFFLNFLLKVYELCSNHFRSPFLYCNYIIPHFSENVK